MVQKEIQKTLNTKEEKTKKIPSPSAASETKADTLNSLGRFFSLSSEKESIIKITNDEFVIELSTLGADIKKAFLKKYKNWYSADTGDSTNYFQHQVQLINYSKQTGPDLSFISSDGKAITTAKLLFKTDAKKSTYKISGDDSLKISFVYRISDNKEIRKIYTFYGNKYHIATTVELVGMNDIISNNSYDFQWKSGIRFVEENSHDEMQQANASVFYGDEQVIVDASDLNKSIDESFTGKVDWVAARNKYFTIALVPENSNAVEGAFIEGIKTQVKPNDFREFYDIRLNIPFKNTDFERQNFLVYLGPIDYSILKEYNRNLEKIVDFGSFFGLKIIVRPIAEYVLLPLFNFLHLFIPNYGFVIIVFSIIIKFVLYPLTKKSYQSMKKMQLLQPKIAELKEKYKDDPQKMNKETMKLYSTYGVNPAGGCLPLVLQMPVFIALWGLFKTAIELRQQPFIFWIKDLSVPDIIYTLPFKLPLIGIDQISGLAILMGITTFVQQKMSVKDPKQQALIYVMPIFLTLLFMSFPSGLNLYYFLFNLFSIAQQYYINHKHDNVELVPVKSSNKKKGFMQRMMEAAEQSAKTQQKKRR